MPTLRLQRLSACWCQKPALPPLKDGWMKRVSVTGPAIKVDPIAIMLRRIKRCVAMHDKFPKVLGACQKAITNPNQVFWVLIR